MFPNLWLLVYVSASLQEQMNRHWSNYYLEKTKRWTEARGEVEVKFFSGQNLCGAMPVRSSGPHTYPCGCQLSLQRYCRWKEIALI